MVTSAYRLGRLGEREREILLAADEALRTGCCLNLYFPARSSIVEVHATGIDYAGAAIMLVWEEEQSVRLGTDSWRIIQAGALKAADLSGYKAEAPRPGFVKDHPVFSYILNQI